MEFFTEQIIIGNILSTIASVWMIVTGVFKNKDIQIIHQTGYIFVYFLSNLVLGAYTGAVAFIITIIRNLLYYKNVWGKWIAVVFATAYFVGAYFTSSNGIVDILPPVASCVYVYAMGVNDDLRFKLLLILNIVLWFPYFVFMQNYMVVVFDVCFVVSSIIGVMRILKDKKVEEID